MTKKEKEEKVKEMEQFINHGIPDEAKEKECIWEEEPPIHTYAIEAKQRVKESKKELDVRNSKNVLPARFETASIKAPDDEKEKSSSKSEKSTDNQKSGR